MAMQEVEASQSKTSSMDVRLAEKLWIPIALAAALGVGYLVGGNGSEAPPVAVTATTRPAAATPSGELTVHVVGLVKKPGLYKLPTGSRVQDAIDRAGGPGAHADLESINLAQRLEDGVQIRVSKIGTAPQVEALGSFSAPGGAAGSSSGSRGSARPAPKSISLNSASAGELDRLPGVGPSTAAKILEYRRAHGGFASIDELLAVKGIGTKKLKDMRPYLRL